MAFHAQSTDNDHATKKMRETLKPKKTFGEQHETALVSNHINFASFDQALVW